MRVIVSRVLLAASILSLAACVILGVDVIQGYQRAVAKDDFAGFSLGMHFLLYVLVPLTLSLFIAACVVDPPARLVEGLGIGTSSAGPSKTALRTALVVLCLAGAAVITVGVVTFVGGNVLSAARHYPYGIRGLVLILVQNLVFSIPLLMLGAVLAWGACALQGRPTA